MARIPKAALLKPVVLAKSALTPTAVLEPTPLSFWSALTPTAVSPLPLTLAKSVNAPTAVLLKGFAPGSGVSVALCTCWQSAKHTRISGMRNERHDNGAWFIGFPRFALTDWSFLRSIVFIVCPFLHPSRFFGNTQNCVRILLPGAAVFC